MSQSRIRATGLGLLAMLLVGSYAAATASAGGGPFWFHREIGSMGNGLKISPQAPENFRGTGGRQTLIGTFSGGAVEVSAPSVQVKGAIFNTGAQGQIKLEIIYNQPEVLKPEKTPCAVTVGAKNIVTVKGHLVWKWNGMTTQLIEQPVLNQTPELLFTPKEMQQGATSLPGGTFTTLTFVGSGCGLLAGPQNVGGSEIGLPSPSEVLVWSKKLAVRTLSSGQGENLRIHFWNGSESIGVNAGLQFAGNAANLIGQTEAEAAQQEISVQES
jgi:hypothetical protein